MSISDVERAVSGTLGAAYRDLSGTITTGGTAQTAAAANSGRDHAFIGNPNASGTLWVNDLGGTAAPYGAGSTPVVPGQTVTTRARNAISVYHATTGATYTLGEA